MSQVMVTLLSDMEILPFKYVAPIRWIGGTAAIFQHDLNHAAVQ